MRGILFAISLVVLVPGAVADLPLPGPTELEANYDAVAHSVTLAWLPDNAADGFNVYRNGELLSTVQTASFLDENLPLVEAMVYEVTTLRDHIESAPATVVVAATHSSWPRELVRSSPTPDGNAVILGYNPCPPVGFGGAPPNVIVVAWNCLPNPPSSED